MEVMANLFVAEPRHHWLPQRIVTRSWNRIKSGQ